MQTPMTSCHIIPMWYEWNANPNDIMMMLFTLHANLVMSCLPCPMCVHIHGACALCRTSISKYMSGLAYMQPDLNLAKITASHVQVLNTQNVNQNMPNMIPITYLNKNFTNCNENLAWGK